MVSLRLVCGGGVFFVLLNIVLLVVLVALIVLRTPRKDRKENLDVDKYNTTVQQELGTLTRFSKASDITKVRNGLASIYQRDGNLRKPAAHLVITDVINPGEDVPVLHWRRYPNLTFQSEQVLYQDGMLSVCQGGYYYIYSSIRYTGNGTAELDHGRIIHNVLMRKDSEKEESPTVLMQNLQSTPTIRRGRETFITSSLGATFYLPANSKVTVTSSIPKNIDTSPVGSYFGLFLV